MPKPLECAVCVIDIGSPKLGNIGWCQINPDGEILKGTSLDDAIAPMANSLKHGGLMLGLEAPLFVPIREDIMLATKARKGEERRPWSAGAGAQVLAMNIPIMTYILKKLYAAAPDARPYLNVAQGFECKPSQVLIFEAFVSGADKGTDHEDDAYILAKSCARELKAGRMPQSVIAADSDTYLNLIAAALLYCGWESDCGLLREHSHVYKPNGG